MAFQAIVEQARAKMKTETYVPGEEWETGGSNFFPKQLDQSQMSQMLNHAVSLSGTLQEDTEDDDDSDDPNEPEEAVPPVAVKTPVVEQPAKTPVTAPAQAAAAKAPPTEPQAAEVPPSAEALPEVPSKLPPPPKNDDDDDDTSSHLVA